MSVFSNIRQWGGGLFHGNRQKDDEPQQNADSRNGLRQKGFGIQSTTIAYSPFHSRTRTVKVENPRKAVKPGEVRPTLKRTPAGSESRVPYSSSAAEWNIKQPQAPDNFLPDLAKPELYRALCRDPALFPAGSSIEEAQLDTALLLLHFRLDKLPDKADVPADVAGAEMAVITQALALACKGRRNALADATRGLVCLQNLNLVELVRNYATAKAPGEDATFKCPYAGVGPGGHASGEFDEDDLDCAWRIALHLAETPVGFAALKKMTRQDALQTGVHESVKQHDEAMLRVYLRAGLERAKRENKLLPEGPGQKPPPIHPGVLHRETGAAKNARTLLDKGLASIHERLCHSHAHASNAATASNPYCPVHDRYRSTHEWAIAAIRNGVYTDEPEENGKPTLFRLMEGRLEKMDTWVKLVNKELDKPEEVRISEAEKKERKRDKLKRHWNRFIGNVNSGYKSRVKKTPLRALDGKDNKAKFANAELSGIGDGRAFRDGLILNLEAALKSRGGPITETVIEGEEEYKGDDAAPVVDMDTGLFHMAADGKQYITIGDPRYPNERSLQSAVRLAILEQIREDTFFLLPQYLHGEKLDTTSLDRARARLSNYIEGGIDKLPESTRLTIERMLHANNAQITVEKIVEWAADVGGPATVDVAIASNKQRREKALERAQLQGQLQAQAMPPDDLAFREDLMLSVEAELKSRGGPIIREVEEHKGDDDAPVETVHTGLFRKAADGKQYIVLGEALDQNERSLLNVARLAILEQVRFESASQSPRFGQGGKLNEIALREARDRVSSYIVGGIDGLSPDDRLWIDQLLDMNNLPVTADRMRSWAALVGGEASVDEAIARNPASQRQAQDERVQAPAGGTPDWHAFNRAVARLVNGTIVRTHTPPISSLKTRDEIGVVLENHINRQELGSTSTMVESDTIGFRPGILAGTIISLKTLLLFRPRVKTDITQTRSAIISVGPNPEGDELFLGTNVTTRVEGGGGVTGIVPITDVLASGIGGELTYAREHARKRGITIRFPRTATGAVWHGKEGLDLDPENNEKLGRLTRKLISKGEGETRNKENYHNAPAGDDNSMLKNLWQEWPEASINWVGKTEKGQSEVTNAFKKQIDTFAGGGHDALRFWAGVGENKIKKWGQEEEWGETGGALHVDKFKKINTSEVNAFGSPAALAAIYPISSHSVPGVDGVDATIAQAIPGIEAMGINLNVKREGTIEDVVLVEQDGELTKDSYFQIAYLTAKDFADAIEERVDDWAQTKARKFGKALNKVRGEKEFVPTGMDNEQIKMAARENLENTIREAKQQRKILEHAEDSLNNPTPTQVYLAFYEIKEEALHAAKVLKSMAMNATALGFTKEAKQYMEHREKILRSQNAYEPGYLVDSQFEQDTRKVGIDYGVVANRSTTMFTTNLRSFD